MADKTIIKKYGNRRLYDTARSRYINLEDIPAILKAGADVEVRDASTNDEITAAVLLQIIVEREKRKVEGLPLDLLKEFVILQDTPGKRFFDQAMRQGLTLLREMKKAGFPTVDSAAAWFDPAAWVSRLFPEAVAENAPPPDAREGTDPVDEPQGGTGSHTAPHEVILRQLDELKKRLEKIERKRR
jgi:polyhydroxyalkanoate synthesis repressor PhaR